MNQHGPKSASDQPLNAACNACRTHKVRCLPNPLGTSKTCQRCARTDRTCVYTAPQKRKQRKRTDTRVAELEREVQAMRALFDRTSNSGSPALLPNASETPGLNIRIDKNHANNYRSSNSPSENCPPTWMEESNEAYPQEPSHRPFSPDSDVIDRGIISIETVNQLFQSYKEDLVQLHPCVVFTTNLTAEELRKTKPTLFLSVIAAAAAKSDSHLYSILNSEVLSAYAHRTVVRGEKNLELVQAMIITSVWYFPPGKFAQLKFYEYIHMATTMGLDIGLGLNPKGSRSRKNVTTPETPNSEALDEEDIEKRRTYLVCYLISTGVSMSMRRPNMLRWNSWVGICVETLEDNPWASKWDHLLAAWVRLLKITEEAGITFAFDDMSNIPDLSEPRTQLAMTGLEKSAEAYWKSLPPEIADNAALKLQYHHTQLYIHEIALHDDHPPEDFQPPFSLLKVLSIHVDPTASNSYIDAISMLISSAHAILDIILTMDLEVVRALPVYNFVRMSYAMIILIKLYISSKTPESKIGAVLASSSLKVGVYLKASIDKLAKAVGPKECRAPFTFLGMFMRLHGWYKGQEKEKSFFAPPMPTNTEECWLPPVPRVPRDTEAKTPRNSNDIPFGPKHPDWQPYSIPTEELENLDFSDAPDLDMSEPLGFDFDALNNFQYESMGDVDQFLNMGAGHSHIPGDSWSMTEDILAPGFMLDESWMQNAAADHSS